MQQASGVDDARHPSSLIQHVCRRCVMYLAIVRYVATSVLPMNLLIYSLQLSSALVVLFVYDQVCLLHKNSSCPISATAHQKQCILGRSVSSIIIPLYVRGISEFAFTSTHAMTQNLWACSQPLELACNQRPSCFNAWGWLVGHLPEKSEAIR